MSSIEVQSEINISCGLIKQLFVKTKNGQITAISMEADPAIPIDLKHDKLVTDLEQQLNDYASQAHNNWTVNLFEQGTEFQRRVWNYLQTIPLGETRTYGEIAKVLSSSARAVGNACRANPYLLVVPCHRVTAKSGVGGFAGHNDGEAVAIKNWLLEHERR